MKKANEGLKRMFLTFTASSAKFLTFTPHSRNFQAAVAKLEKVYLRKTFNLRHKVYDELGCER